MFFLSPLLARRTRHVRRFAAVQRDAACPALLESLERRILLSCNAGYDIEIGGGAGMPPVENPPYHVEHAATYGVGNYPRAVTLGDVDGDGDLDIVTANFYDNDVSVVRGDGAAGRTDYSVGRRPWGVTLGDVDGDGDLDMVVANFSDSDVSVLRGDGAGGFAGRVDYGVGDGPSSVTLGDVDGDGDLDIVTANNNFTDPDNGSVSVLRGDGAGGFSGHTVFAVGRYPISVALGDVDGDGDLDIVTSNGVAFSSINDGTVSVLRGDGLGGFSGLTAYGVGDSPHSLALGDVDGDGDLDIVTAEVYSQRVSVLRGDGAGGFADRTAYQSGDYPGSMALGDIDGDGDLDIVTASNRDNTITVMRGDGSGGFAERADYQGGDRPTSVTLGDRDGDGDLDIVTANYVGDDVTVLDVVRQPTISHVSADPVTPSNRSRPFTVLGANFDRDAKVTLRDHRTGEVFPDRPVISRSTTQITINPIVTTETATWSVEVINPGNLSSGQFEFQVIELLGDVNLDAVVDAADIHAVALAVVSGSSNPLFDLNEDSVVNAADIDHLVRVILDTEYGDANLDGRVSITDLSIVATNFAKPGGWAKGNFVGVDGIDIADLSRLAAHFGFNRGALDSAPATGAGGVIADLLAEASPLVTGRSVVMTPAPIAERGPATTARWSHIAALLDA